MTESVVIGVHVHAEPMRLQATLASLRAHAPAARIVLLPDGPDEATRTILRRIDLPQLGTTEPRGAPACWNRLVAGGASDAEVTILLESGAELAPGALELLVGALRAPPHGLVGPSTNLAWNEQCAFPGARSDGASIAATARAARARFGETVRPLTPLHSLADFCFTVRRDAIHAVGQADEAYGLGPCWEMDYSVRAARAGFVGVWACAAYVFRAPFTARRRVEEARRFEASRRRYQDKFCGRRLRGERLPYEPHCKGESCVDFAPRELVRLREPAASSPPPAETPPRIVAGDQPLVTCIMPSRDRRAWVPQAIRYFLRQDLAEAELVIVDDGDSPVSDCVPDHPRIRYHRTPGRRSIGAKRNEACRLARGELIAHWDDDDWYAPSRLRRQVDALHTSGAEICGSSELFFYEPSATRAWRYRHPANGSPMLVGTTLLYRRRAWERMPFADIQVGEDVRFVRAAAGPLHDLRDPSLCVATIHSGNTSPRRPDPLFWQPAATAEIYRLFAGDLPFYERGALPLISCIMPTGNRRAFVELALRAFGSQDWPRRELIIVDDGNEPMSDAVANRPDVRYIRLSRRISIGAKRNLACAEARGELIAHWDDDDWYGPGRLSWQASPIVSGDADVTGLENKFMLELPSGAFWTTKPDLHRRMFVGDVHGGTLVYRRALFTDGLRYPDTNLAEDAALLRAAMERGRRLARLDNPELFVYVRHGANAWQFPVGQFIDPMGWKRTAAPTALPAATLEAYRRAAARRSDHERV